MATLRNPFSKPLSSHLGSSGEHLAPRFLSRRRDLPVRTVAVGAAAAAGLAALGLAASLGLRARMRKSRALSLRGKVVLITGSSRGLGLAMAEEFGRLGARIILTARDQAELERARELLHILDAVHPDNMLVVPADLRLKEDVEYLAHRVRDRWGHVDILVNNAGVITVGPVEHQTIQDFHEVMDSNFFTGVHCTLALLPDMLRRGEGTIVNITSIGGKVAVPHLLPYSASKFAAVGFSEGLHAELRDKGIHVVTVCPGLMRTGSHLNASFTGDAEREYQWFSFGATTPGVSVSARQAARRVVRAVLDRETELFISPQAALAGRVAPLMPAVTALISSLVNRLLPSAVENAQPPTRGAAVRGKEPMPASTLGWDAARRYNELGGTPQ